MSDASTDLRARQLFTLYLTHFPTQYKEISVVGLLGYLWQYQSSRRACSKTLARLRIVAGAGIKGIFLYIIPLSVAAFINSSSHAVYPIGSCLNLREVFLGVTRSPGRGPRELGKRQDGCLSQEIPRKRWSDDEIVCFSRRFSVCRL